MSKMTVILCLAFVAFVLLCLVIMGSIQFVQLNDTRNRILKTVDNQIYCPDGNEKEDCMLSPNMLLAIPENSSVYSEDIALFGCNLIACLEFAFLGDAVADSSKEIEVPSGVEIVKRILYRDTVLGLVCKTTNATWVVFRGSQTVAEWQQDLMIQQISCPTKFTGKIHEGFLNIYNQIEQEIHSCLTGIQSDFLYIFGISLGGALGQLLQIDSSQTLLFSEKHVYLFGTPRVGDLDFALSQTDLNIYRFTNEADIVCELPPSVSPNFVGNPNDVFLYQHNEKQNIRFIENRSSFMENHSIKAYLFYLTS